MTIKYNNVYINSASTIAGPYEKKGPLGSYYDKTYDEFYLKKPSFEQAESKLIEESIDILLIKQGITRFDVDLLVSGDLQNQITASNYASSRLGIPYLGIYSACATSCEGLIIASNMIEAKQIKNAICATSSHNNVAEKQFRFPVEYGGPKHKTATFTTTGGVSAYLSYNKEGIKVESATIGSVIDLGVKDVYNMGAVMAPAAADTLYKHLIETKREINYYDLILTGDLGIYGKDILIEYMKNEYNIILNNYNDSATMIYDLKVPEIKAGGSGPACLPLVTYGYVFDMIKKKKLNKVLIIATGALMNSTLVNQKLSIPAIAHAVSLEAII